MFESTAINSVLAVILTVLVCFVISTLLPGIERKYVHARIQTLLAIRKNLALRNQENLKSLDCSPGSV